MIREVVIREVAFMLRLTESEYKRSPMKKEKQFKVSEMAKTSHINNFRKYSRSWYSVRNTSALRKHFIQMNKENSDGF